ncbi:MAG: SpoIIE family protein phosphatase [Anaerolineae bacterium]
MKHGGWTTSGGIDRASRWLILATLVLAGIVFVGAPVLALSWRTRPFPGFVVEQTLLVADYGGKEWSQAQVRQSDLERVTQVGDSRVDTLQEFNAALLALSVGQETVVHTVSRDRTVQVYPSIRVIRFPTADLVRLFWLPYGVGLVYLGIGLWVYRVRGSTRYGRAFAFFCASTSIATALIFDLSTTHVGSGLWTTAMAFEGAVLLSLALVFPQESRLARRVAWARFLPYVPSVVLAGWGLLILWDDVDPWRYVGAWRASYAYAALGIVAFVGMAAYRLFTAPERPDASSGVVRQQARVILVGSLLAFAPLGVWLGAPAFGTIIPFHTALFVPFLLVFPLSIALAILRYRLWDIDLIINRTLVYGVLVTILAAVYYVAVVALQGLFRVASGQSSPLAVAVSTLGIAVLFNPVRRRVQDLVDRRFYRSKYDAAKTLSAFGESLRDEVDLSRLVQRMEDVAREALQPTQITLWLCGASTFRQFKPGETADQQMGGEIQLSERALERLRTDPGVLQLSRAGLDQASTRVLEDAGAEWIVPLVCRNELVGWLGLGERLSGQAYSLDDRALLRDLATQAGPAIRVAQLVLDRQEEARKSARLAYELRLARLIQQTLLPKNMPELPGWQIAVHWQPARAVGGDFYDVLALPDGRLVLVIADVVDKGIPAALIMASTRSILRGTAKRMLSPGEALAQANEILYPELPQGMFVTCLYAILDPVTGRLQYANAGHNWPYRRRNGEVAEVRAKGMVLGVMPGTSYEDCETTIAAGETVLLYSDGLVEAHNPEGEMFGSERLQASMLEQAESGTPLIEYLLDELADFTGSEWEQEDDITLLTVQRHEMRRAVDEP